LAFYQAFDPELRAAVLILTGATNSDADYQAYVDTITEFDERCAGRDGAVVLVVDDKNPPPSAAWRKKIADSSAHLKSKPVFALVSTSVLVRGVVTAINWIRPPSYAHAVASTPQEAFQWAERQLGRSLPFERLYAQARSLAQASR
jgi:hypothetical protein